MDFAYKRFFILLATYLTAYYLSLNFTDSYWLLWSAFLFSLPSVSDTFTKQISVIIVTVILTAIAAVIVKVASMALIIILLFSLVVHQYYPDYFLSAFVISLFSILSFALPVNVYLILIGGLINLIFQFIAWPNFINDKMRHAQSQAIIALKELTQEIFACFFASDYKNNIYLYERRIHAQKQYFLRWLEQLRDLNMTRLIKKKLPIKSEVILKLEQLYANTLDFSQLRLRVADHATFELCQKEMTELGKILNQIYQKPGFKKLTISTEDLTRFEKTIKRFEENYQQVLQVASHQPADFLLFITSMKLLHKRFSEL